MRSHDRRLRSFRSPACCTRDSDAACRFQVDVIEADTGPHDHPTFWDPGYEVGVDLHLMPRHNAVRLRESVGGKPVDAAFPTDRPVDICSSGPPLDLGVVGILRVGGQEMETQRHFAPG